MRNITPGQEYNNADPCTLNPAVSTALRTYLPKHFPGIKATSTVSAEAVPAQDTCVSTPAPVAVESEWIGIMGFTPDRNPLVGALATRPGEFIAAGYTGHGMPVAYLAGRNIAEMICGIASDIPVPAAYHPSRFNV
jgi:glycine/D-amino acid oxidase-like deaminating enzyme